MILQTKYEDQFVTRLVRLKDPIAVVLDEFVDVSNVKPSTSQLGILKDLSVHASSGQLEAGNNSCAATNAASTVKVATLPLTGKKKYISRFELCEMF